MKRYAWATVFWITPSVLWAQVFELPPGSGDCKNAIQIGESCGPTSPPTGYGNELEISGNDKESIWFFEKEHNTVWYQFKAPGNAQLAFDIVPVNKNDDVDFLLFKIDEDNFCGKIKSKQVKPVRTNISRGNPEIGGKTGLSATAENNCVHSGPGDSYSNPVEVKKGEQFYLVVDHYTENPSGHKVNLRYENSLKMITPPKMKKTEENDEPEAELKDEGPLMKKALNIAITDAETGKHLNATLEVFGAKRHEPLVIKETHLFSMELEPYRSYIIHCDKKGYLYYSRRIITGDKPKTINIDIELEPIKAGKKITIRDIYFRGDEADILPSSKDAITLLVKFMQENPKIKIEIQGHVNARHNSRKAKELSKERASAVYYELILKDIPRDRMKPKGFGNTRMIYKTPRDEAQSAANRRVEIHIVSTD